MIRLRGVVSRPRTGNVWRECVGWVLWSDDKVFRMRMAGKAPTQQEYHSVNVCRQHQIVRQDVPHYDQAWDSDPVDAMLE